MNKKYKYKIYFNKINNYKKKSRKIYRTIKMNNSNFRKKQTI